MRQIFKLFYVSGIDDSASIDTLFGGIVNNLFQVDDFLSIK
jgi:hypothetical protein